MQSRASRPAGCERGSAWPLCPRYLRDCAAAATLIRHGGTRAPSVGSLPHLHDIAMQTATAALQSAKNGALMLRVLRGGRSFDAFGPFA